MWNQERGKPRPGEPDLKPGTRGHGCPGLFCVAQIVNLLYRRLAIGSALVEVRGSGRGAVLQDGILRYSRLAVCATRTAEALNPYGCPRSNLKSVLRED